MEDNSNLCQKEATAAEGMVKTSVNESVSSETIETNNEVDQTFSGLETDQQCTEESVKPEDDIVQSPENDELLSDSDDVGADGESDTENETLDGSIEQAVKQEEWEDLVAAGDHIQEDSSKFVNNSETTVVETDDVIKSIDLLRDGLNQALISLNRKNADIRLIEDKLDTYKRTVEDKLVNMFFIDIISVIDSIKRMSKLYREKYENPGYVSCDEFEFYATDLECILLNNSVEIIPTAVGEKFNPRNQRIIKKIPTDDKNLHGTIEHIFSEGYLFGGKVISPAKIAAYFYTEPKDQN